MGGAGRPPRRTARPGAPAVSCQLRASPPERFPSSSELPLRKPPSKLITRNGNVWIPRVRTPAPTRVPAPAQLVADAVPAAIPPETPGRDCDPGRGGRLPAEWPASGAERTSDRRQSQVRAGRPRLRGSAGGLGLLLPRQLEVHRGIPGASQPLRPRPDLRPHKPGLFHSPRRPAPVLPRRPPVLRRDHLCLTPGTVCG